MSSGVGAVPGERNAAATRIAILTAARAEFSEHGFAGARVDRIATESGKNRAMIYAYFDSKERLFDAVFDGIVEAVTSQVALDAEDLAGYAVGLFDEGLRDPQPVRLASWDRLERGAAGLQAGIVRSSNDAKVAAIAAAQAAGRVSGRIPADELLNVIVALSRLHGRGPAGQETTEELSLRRDALHAAVTAVTTP